MYGSIFKLYPKPGCQDAVEQLFRQDNEWENSTGVAACLFGSDNYPGELTGIAIFTSEEAYRQNANHPAQQNWYNQLRDLLQSDPEWNDGPVLVMHELTQVGGL